MDYSKLSDFEINKLVASAQSLLINANQCASLKAKSSSVLVNYAVSSFEFNPCNNPSDAWPIIFDNNICITFRKNKTSLISAYNDCPNECVAGKELREAMIVYLMMQEDK